MDEVQFGQNIYCGPAVLSIYTGCTTDDCAEEIQKVNGKANIKGVYPPDLITAGSRMGLKFDLIESFNDRSIFWVASVLTKMEPAMYLVTIPDHYIALEVRDGRIYICDNHTKTELPLERSARLSQKIEKLWRVIKVREFFKARIVNTAFHAEILGKDTYIKQVHTMSDGGIKIVANGVIYTNGTQHLQEIAFELMRLSGKDK